MGNFFIDAHLHVTPPLLPYLQTIPCIANADCPEEYHWLRANATPHMTISVGIHPWKAAVTSWAEMEPLLRSCAVIGEIGLDRVWCDTDLEIQRNIFHRQLELAHSLGTPVILHTKGMEQEILHTIRQYPNRYLVHWYSCGAWQRDYIDLGCWFTVGPDLLSTPYVEQLAKTVPLNRLLLESDGMDAISWAQKSPLAPCDYPNYMRQHLQAIALLRGIPPHVLLAQITENLNCFLR